jgi:predicted aconitase with swiveling domain
MTNAAPTAGEVLFAGAGEGPLLRLSAPLSFWGGIDPVTGRIILGSHPERGQSVSGSVLALADPIGSSSSSYIMLELIHSGHAPAAILLGRPDAILVVGCLAAREMGWRAPPVLVVPPTELAQLPAGRLAVADGRVGAAS